MTSRHGSMSHQLIASFTFATLAHCYQHGDFLGFSHRRRVSLQSPPGPSPGGNPFQVTRIVGCGVKLICYLGSYSKFLLGLPREALYSAPCRFCYNYKKKGNCHCLVLKSVICYITQRCAANAIPSRANGPAFLCRMGRVLRARF